MIKPESHIAANSQLEMSLVGIWSAVLDIDENDISVDDNFFSLGGNSISVVALAARIEKQLACRLLPVTLFKYNSIKALSQHLYTQIAPQNVERQDTSGPLNKDATKLQENGIPTRPSTAVPGKIDNNKPDYYRDSLALVGVSCHFPEADDQWQFWDNLIQGRESVNTLSLDEAEAANVATATSEN